MARETKHIGKMKNNGAKVLVAYRTLPGDSGSALVIGTNRLSDTWHDTLMSVVQDVSGQQANELADILSIRKFPDGQYILEALHKRGLLIKVPTNGVIMTPTSNASILLSELNAEIAKIKSVTIDELAISDGFDAAPKRNTFRKDDPTKTTSASVNASDDLNEVNGTPDVEDLSPSQLRSKADKLFKEAQVLRKQADELDPPKSKKKRDVVVDEE